MGTSKLTLLIFSMNDSNDDKYAANCLKIHWFMCHGCVE